MTYTDSLLKNYETKTGVVTVRNLDNHPLYRDAIRSLLTPLRDENTDTRSFRSLTMFFYELYVLPEILQWLPHEEVEIITGNSADYHGTRLKSAKVLMIEIPRAGTGPTDRLYDDINEVADQSGVFLDIRIGVIDLKRVEEEGQELRHDVGRIKIPEFEGDNIYAIILDPMVATGRSCEKAIRIAYEKLYNAGGISHLFIGSLVATPEGIENVADVVNELNIATLFVSGAIDPELDDRKYIVPGLGDAGDRLFNT